jgi:DNA polymerase Ligase (LigD)
MPRFVILEHDHPERHWDLMLEAGAALRTWRLARPPEAPGEVIEATALADHRLHYLDYDGPVSHGRGVVKRWDAGEYEDVQPGDAETLCVRLHGSRVQGLVWMRRVGEDRWTFEWPGG